MSTTGTYPRLRRLMAVDIGDDIPSALLASSAILIFCCWGLGYNWLPGVALSACWIRLALKGDGGRWKRCAIWGVALVIAACPPVAMLYGPLVATIWLTTRSRALLAAPLSLWAIEELPVESGLLPWLPLLRIAICAAAIYGTAKFRPLPALLLFACGALTVLEVFAPPRFDAIEDYEKLGYGYKPGQTLWQNLGHDTPCPRVGQAPLRGYLHGTKIDPATPGLIVVEHDQWVGRDKEPIDSSNQQVDIPWNDNCWPGRQHLRHAIAKDGFMSSNLGGRLKPQGRVELCYLDHGTLRPTLVSRGKTTWSGDSDYLNNSLTAYNRWYVPELNKTGAYFRLSRLANLSLASVFLLPTSAMMALAVLSLTVLSVNLLPGDVRIAGGIGDPHDEGGASGVPDMINTKGHSALPGQFGANILIVPPGVQAVHLGEKLIILGGGSRLYSATLGIIEAEDTPLGVIGEIQDARSLRFDGTNNAGITPVADGLNSPQAGRQLAIILKSKDGTTLIGTSSPGRLKWETLYK